MLGPPNYLVVVAVEGIGAEKDRIMMHAGRRLRTEAEVWVVKGEDKTAGGGACHNLAEVRRRRSSQPDQHG